MELKLDFNTPTMGPVEISYVGDMPSVKILDHNEHMQEVTAKGEPKKVILKNMYAFPFNWVSLNQQASFLFLTVTLSRLHEKASIKLFYTIPLDQSYD